MYSRSNAHRANSLDGRRKQEGRSASSASPPWRTQKTSFARSPSSSSARSSEKSASFSLANFRRATSLLETIWKSRGTRLGTSISSCSVASISSRKRASIRRSALSPYGSLTSSPLTG